MTTPSDSLHNIDANIERINQNINNIYSMLNIISNSIILNQLNDIRRPRIRPSLFTTPSPMMPNIFSNTTSNTSNTTSNTSNEATSNTTSNTNNTSNTTSNTNNTTSNTNNTTSNTNNTSNPLTNLFSSMLRNEGFPMPVGMEISVLGGSSFTSGTSAGTDGSTGASTDSSEEEHIVISHHNIFNNTKIKLKTYPNNSELEQCTICLANIENNQIVREINKCKHCFHVECADKWFEEHITCPHCRQDIRIEMVD